MLLHIISTAEMDRIFHKSIETENQKVISSKISIKEIYLKSKGYHRAQSYSLLKKNSPFIHKS